MAGIPSGGVFSALAVQVWTQNSLGVALGQLDPDSTPTPDTTSHAYKIPGLITADLPQPTYDTAVFRGDQTIQGQADLGASDYGQFTLEITSWNATLAGLLTGSLVDTTSLTNVTIASPDTGKIAPRQMGVMLTAQIQDTDPDSATFGENKYISYLFPKVQIRINAPNVSQGGGDNPNPASLICTPTRAGKFPGGNAMGANQGWTNNKEIYYTMVSENPFALTAFVQNAVATTYTVKYVPASTAITGGNTDNWFTVNAVVTAPTSISAVGLVTLAAAGSSGDVDSALYQTADSFTPN